ncbi:LacI family DNA-binding transcriptional regulator [Mesorhizobium sp. BAC0120]|uniref:LacI family DNA-binding transcriptional regulator n=1 Tax=Mesorhizobium sp. BAC0120 TaxID=3090670 RepID=UPI00298BF1DE|nr:LacI family DNA-binding transcriptional regulator [Mesorhizobium sp. BAC0120]MDW6025424.1 LacI family DNA-binding transcriptional regulator [Mesorhizobium sp. BAC0120]
MRKWTISDLAREANVSKTTVSRVLNGRPDVDAETSARLLALIEDVGYVRSARAVQLAKGRANVVGLLAPFDTSPWMIEVLRAAMERVQATHFSLVLHSFPHSPAEMARFADQLNNGSMDALMVVSLQQEVPAIAKAAADGLPVVMLNDYGFNAGLADIIPDEAVGIAEAVAHLVAVGRRRFAIIAGTPDFPISATRLDAYRQAIRKHGLELDEQLVIEAPFTAPAAQAATLALVDRGVGFDALFASSDAMAVGAMRALKQRGLAIPDDVSVVGFDDFASAEFTEPRLTTVHNPLYEMSARAMAQLLDGVKANKPIEKSEEVIGTHLIVRDSSVPSRNGAGGRG